MVAHLGELVAAAGFDVKSNPSIQTSSAWLRKAPTSPAIGDLNRTNPVTVQLGLDRRWMYPSLVRRDLGDALSIQDFVQTVRTVTGTVERSPVATTDKAILATTLTLANEAVKQLAVIMDAIPVALLESVDGMRTFFEQELRFQIEKALDAHVFAQIVASSPPFGNTGADLVARVRNGIASMRNEGADPSVLVVNPTDAVALDLYADAGGLVFGTRDTGVASPLWGLRIVEHTTTLGNEPPYLLDPQMLGVLYTGSTTVDADPYTGVSGANFKRNTVDIRAEVSALYHVRNNRGARRIAAT